MWSSARLRIPLASGFIAGEAIIAVVIPLLVVLGVVLAIPSMLAQLVRRDLRDVVMAVWSAYMPAGITLMLFAGPLLPTIGWRNFWFANALMASLCAVLLAIYAPAMSTAPREATSRFEEDRSRTDAPMRMRFGVYFYAEPDDSNVAAAGQEPSAHSLANPRDR